MMVTNATTISAIILLQVQNITVWTIQDNYTLHG